jgi:hypothetical protein
MIQTNSLMVAIFMALGIMLVAGLIAIPTIDQAQAKKHHKHRDHNSANNNDPIVTSSPPLQPQQPLQSTGHINSANGLNDACLRSGFSQEKCDNILFSTNPGGFCTTLTIAGVPCPKIQDPAKTFNDPSGALAESEARSRATEGAIQGFNRLFPSGPNGFASSFGGSTG